MNVESRAFEPGGMIPATHTCDGTDASPALAWSEPPEGTKSFALICDDPDAPAGTWVHWVAWNIPGVSRSLPGGVPPSPELRDGTRQGMNDFHRHGYGGPCPPSGTHRYFFRLYALDRSLDLPAGASRREVERAMAGHILAEAVLLGNYRRA